MPLETEILVRKIRDLDLTVTFCAALLGGAPNLNAELSGLRPLPNDRFLTLNKKLDMIAEIVEKVKPLRLNFKDAGQVREWLRLYEAGDLKLAIAEAAPAEKAVEYNVTFGKHFYAGRNSSGRDLGHPEKTKALSLSFAEAVEVCRRLKQMGFPGSQIIEASKVQSANDAQ